MRREKFTLTESRRVVSGVESFGLAQDWIPNETFRDDMEGYWDVKVHTLTLSFAVNHSRKSQEVVPHSVEMAAVAVRRKLLTAE